MAALDRSLLALVLFAAIAACSSGGRSARAADSSGVPRSVSAGDFRLDALEAQTLERGDCGLFLWARSAEQPVFVFVSMADPAEARVRVNGRLQFLRRTAVDGAARYGHFESQTYSGGGVNIQADVQFSTTRQVQDGVLLDGGVLRLRDRQDWETIVPVTGMIACQP